MDNAQDVIDWLNSPDGEQWSRDQIGDTLRCQAGSGAFATIIPQAADTLRGAAHWKPGLGWVS